MIVIIRCVVCLLCRRMLQIFWLPSILIQSWSTCTAVTQSKAIRESRWELCHLMCLQ